MTGLIKILQQGGAIPFSRIEKLFRERDKRNKQTKKQRKISQWMKKKIKRTNYKKRKYTQRGGKKKQTKKQQTKKKKTKKQTKKKLTKKQQCLCKKQTIHTNDPSPSGLGKCPECSPLHIVIKGKNKRLWENQLVNNSHTWVQVY